MCCPSCYFKNLHYGHKVIEINDEESLKKENITIEGSNKEFDTKIDKLNSLNALIEKKWQKLIKHLKKLIMN